MQREWEEAHTVTEELVEGPPSRRANASLTACPNGNHLWCIGGEFFSDDGKAVRLRKSLFIFFVWLMHPSQYFVGRYIGVYPPDLTCL